MKLVIVNLLMFYGLIKKIFFQEQSKGLTELSRCFAVCLHCLTGLTGLILSSILVNVILI